LREVAQEWSDNQTKKESTSSTLANANKIRKKWVFEEIYNNLLKNIALFCRTVEVICFGKKVKMVDKYTAFLKWWKTVNGKSKEGLSRIQ
jgi:hypothetical protein